MSLGRKLKYGMVGGGPDALIGGVHRIAAAIDGQTDPAKAGVFSCVGDIGSHAENLARYITGLEMESILADMTTFVEGRRLEDGASMLVQAW